MIHGILGDVGQGKTLLATFLVYQDYLSGLPILSNIKLNFKFSWLDSLIMRNRKRWHELDNHSILIDEIDSIADNRRSMSKDNIILSSLAWFHRKAGVSIYYTSHQLNFTEDSLRSVDPRIDEYTNHFWLPTANRENPLYIDEVPLFIDVEWFSRNARGSIIKMKEFRITRENIIKLGSLFDTTEIAMNPLDEDN